MDLLRSYERVKTALSDGLELDRSILHVHLGLALYVAAGMLLRGRLGGWAALLVVLAAELVNEGVDFARFHLSGWPWTPDDTIRDILNTMFWPSVLFVAGRLRSDTPDATERDPA